MSAALCIYCRTPLGPETDWAHVIPKCLGGRLKSKSTCCNQCNNDLGRFENELCHALRQPSAALCARNADGDPIRADVEVEGKRYVYANGVGDEKMPAPKYDADSGALVFPLPGGQDEQAEVIARRLWERGLTPQDIDRGAFRIEPDNTFHIRPHPPTPKRIEWVAILGLEGHMRVVAKMALELLAVLRPGDARRHEALRNALRFVRYGEDTLPIRFDALSEGPGLRRSADLPALAHAVEVWTSRRNLHFRVTLFGGLHMTGSLSTAWSGSVLSLLHALDPANPGKHITVQEDVNGPSLGVWRPELKKRAFETFSRWFEAQTQQVAAKVARRPFEYPASPDLPKLRPLIQAKFDALLERRQRRKKK